MSKPAAAGEMAGVVKVARAGTTVDMGPPLGEETCDRDAIILDYFLGVATFCTFGGGPADGSAP
jgi:hypothetical protein